MKARLVKVVCWLIVAPAMPIAFLHCAAEWLGERDPPLWGSWLFEKAEALAERNGVRWG